jgi:transposase
MKKLTSRRRRSAAEWAELVKAWKRSGKSASEFASKHQLEAKTLAWWRWHLGRTKRQDKPRAKRRRAVRKGKPTPRLATPRLIPVDVQGAQQPDGGVAWELESARGSLLRVRTAIAPPELEQVLASMTSSGPGQ